MPTKMLPTNPSLSHLKSQAKTILQGLESIDPIVCQRIREFHPRFTEFSDAQISVSRFKLSDAQLTVAREYGFASWPRLKSQIEEQIQARLKLPAHERIDDPRFRRAVDLLDAGDGEGLRGHLAAFPELLGQRVELPGANYFRNPSLLEFAAENPIRRGQLPKNILSTVKVILDAGVDQQSLDGTLELVASGSLVRMGGVQTELIALLCRYGAKAGSALGAAVAHGEFEAVQSLLDNGAKLDLASSAALGREEAFRRMLPKSGPRARHLALAMAAQFGSTNCLKMLLLAGEDPNRFNPKGAHSHSTPLHQAAYGGHLEVVRALVEAGASTTQKDVLFGGTPLDWAEHGGRAEIADYLRAHSNGA